MSKRDAAPFETPETMRHGSKAGEVLTEKMYYSYGICSFAFGKGKGCGRRNVHTHRAHRPSEERRQKAHVPNRELVQFPEGVRNRTQAIAHRIETAGIKRKVGTNQVKAIRVLLTGSNKDMKQMEADGRLDGWCNDNLKWLRETYGERNLVSAVLHMDEKTSHTRHYRTDSDRGAQESQKGRTEREKEIPQEEHAGCTAVC